MTYHDHTKEHCTIFSCDEFLSNLRMSLWPIGDQAIKSFGGFENHIHAHPVGPETAKSPFSTHGSRSIAVVRYVASVLLTLDLG